MAALRAGGAVGRREEMRAASVRCVTVVILLPRSRPRSVAARSRSLHRTDGARWGGAGGDLLACLDDRRGEFRADAVRAGLGGGRELLGEVLQRGPLHVRGSPE